MSDLEIFEDPREKVQFWVAALSNPNVNRETAELLNQCLQNELKQYLNPPEHILINLKEKRLSG